MKSTYQKGFSLVAIFMAIAAFLGFGVNVASNMQATTTVDAMSQVSQTSSTSDWKTYTDSKLGISVKYPSDWSTGVGIDSDITGDTTSLAIFPAGDTRIVDDPYDALKFRVNANGVGTCNSANSTLLGVAAHDFGWLKGQGGANYRTVCFPSKNFSVDLSALTDQSKALEEKILSTVTFTSGAQSASSNSTNSNMSGGLKMDASVSANVNVAPSIKVLSPNGGETWSVGSNQKVSFELKGNQDLLGSFVDVWLSDENDSSLIKEFPSCYLGGKYTIDVQIPSYIKPGKYKVVATSKSDVLLISPTCVRGTVTSSPPLSEIDDSSDTFINITK